VGKPYYASYVKQLKVGTLVRFEGLLTTEHSQRMRDTLFGQFEKGRNKFIVDLTGVTGIDSTALAILTSLNKELRQNGRYKLALVVGSEEIEKTLEVTGLGQVFGPYYRTVNEAATAFVE